MKPLPNNSVLNNPFKLFFCILSLCYFSEIFAQERTIINGKINAKDSLESPVHIINLNTKRGTTTSKTGDFNIEVSLGDILLFSSIQFKKTEIKITSTILKENLLQVYLPMNINVLEEVRVHKLSGNLSKDISGMESYNLNELGIPLASKPPPTQEERQLYTATTGPGGTRLSLLGVLTGSIPLDPILNGVNGRTAELKERIKIYDLEQLVTKAQKQVPEAIFLEDLKLKQEEIIIFVYYCAEHFNLAPLVDSPLDLIAFFKQKITEFRELKHLD